MFIKEGQQVPVEDLLKGIIVDSGNDACVAMSEHVGGSEKKRNAFHKGQPGLGKTRYKGKIVRTEGKDTLENSIIGRGAAMIFKPVDAEFRRATRRLR